MERRSFIKLAGCSLVAAAAAGALGACEAGEIFGLASSKNADQDASVANQPEISFSNKVDVLIVGSGMAGLSAAMAPVEAGYSVMVAEKLDLLGGESYEANGVMSIAGSSLQLDAGIPTTAEEAWDTYEKEMTDFGLSDLGFAKTLFLAAPKWVDHLIDTYGSQFADPADYVKSGVNESIILPKNGLGDMESIMMPLRDKLSEYGATLQTGYRAVACIISDSGEVCGVRFIASSTGSVVDVRAKRVVIATGGFASSPSMIDEYLPEQEHVGCYTVASMGEGLTLCEDTGGKLANMDTVPPLTSDLPQVTAWGLFGPTIIVDALGGRFAREDVASAAADACVADERGYWWTIFDERLTNGIQSRSLAEVDSKHETRVVGPYKSLKTLAKNMSTPAETLQETFTNYEKQVQAGKDKDFKRTAFLKKLKAPYYAVKQFPVRYRTFGGVQTDESGQVLDSSGNAIDNLYCCGAAAAGNIGGLAAAGPFGMLVGQAVTASLDDEASAA